MGADISCSDQWAAVVGGIVEFLTNLLPKNHFGRGTGFGLLLGLLFAGLCMRLFGTGGYRIAIRQCEKGLEAKDHEITALKEQLEKKDQRIKELHKAVERRKGKR